MNLQVQGEPWRAALQDLPALAWPDEWIGRHRHQHHRFDGQPLGPGAEIEASRGCPYRCTFCAKENFRGVYRRRPLAIVLREIDGLLRQGVEYLYFIDEIFLPDAPLLGALNERRLKFGIQTRIDLWRPEMLELLGRAGCVSIEAGVESLSIEGRRRLAKPCRLTNEEIAGRLVLAKAHVPFVQANLLLTEFDDPAAVAAWREQPHCRRCLGQRPGAPLPFPRLASLPAALGSPGRSGLGAGARLVSGPPCRLQ